MSRVRKLIFLSLVTGIACLSIAIPGFAEMA